MHFNYNKLFAGGTKKKDLIVGIEELGRIFAGSDTWVAKSQLDQYSKSLYVFAAVNKIAMKVASIEIKLFKLLNTDGDSEEVLSHEILDLLSKVNPFQTRSEFLRITMINKKLTGEAFWLKIRDARGAVVELWNLRPDYMTVVTDPVKFVKYYEFQTAGGGKQIFMPEDVIHFKDPDPTNSFRGMSPLRACQSRVETEQSATAYQQNFFKNNARPDALLLTEQALDTEQRSQMTEAWEERHGGDANGTKIGILEGGMKYQQVSISQKEMDYIESMKFTRDDILVAFGVPKAVIIPDDASYANADTAMRTFLSETISPEMKQLVEVLDEFLVIPDFGEEYFLDFIDPTPSDREAERADSTAGFGKWLTTNEIRATYNLPPIEGGDVIAQTQPQFGGFPAGNTLMLARALTMKAKAVKALQKRPGLKLQKMIADRVKDVVTRALSDKKVLTAMKSATKKGTRTKRAAMTTHKELVSLLPNDSVKSMHYDLTNKRLDKRATAFKKELIVEFSKQEERVIKQLQSFDDANKGVYSKMSHTDIASILNKADESKLFSVIALPFMLEFAQAGGQDAASITNETFDMTDALRKAMTKRSHFFANSVTDTTFQQLTHTLTQGINAGEGIGDLTKRVNEVYAAIPEWRAGMIARTETTNANNEGTLEQYRVSTVVTGKEWIATLDDRTRDEHAALNGEIVSVDGVFSNGLTYPQEINCRCVLGPAISA